MAEYLYYTLTFDHFLDIAVYFTDLILLTDKVLAAALADLTGGEHHDCQGEQYKDGQRNAGIEHGAEYRDNGYGSREDLRDAHGDHLTQGIGIVGVMAHDAAMAVGIKIPDGQGLHVGEHLVTDLLHGALGHIGHQPLIGKGSQNTGGIDADHSGDGTVQTGEVPAAACQHGGDIVINQGGQEHGVGYIGEYCDQNADHYHNQSAPVIREDNLQQTAQGILVHMLDANLVFVPQCGTIHSGHSLRLLPSAVMCILRGRSHWSGAVPHGCRYH